MPTIVTTKLGIFTSKKNVNLKIFSEYNILYNIYACPHYLVYLNGYQKNNHIALLNALYTKNKLYRFVVSKTVYNLINHSKLEIELLTIYKRNSEEFITEIKPNIHSFECDNKICFMVEFDDVYKNINKFLDEFYPTNI